MPMGAWVFMRRSPVAFHQILTVWLAFLSSPCDLCAISGKKSPITATSGIDPFFAVFTLGRITILVIILVQIAPILTIFATFCPMMY
ncbi:hypothetical protein SJI19_11865 [Acerihabitans sp. TG2]|uniref:hypothetical protein n=1 Tax=Acerihabitans sp. TG2 TaxID=3096008 RepID=UPI002B2301CF|nr:hypothetical protein [Acerihabitans sp. TG2]MEA9391228.1 hypothetical protein [Acerihabitans sp. TG2]